MNKTFLTPGYSNKQGYQGFPMDCLENFTSTVGYLYPVYWDVLDPGDKVNLQSVLRTKTQPLAKPAMATICERIEWFAVPIDQIYRPFATKFYGINDVGTDLLSTSGYDKYLPFMTIDHVSSFMAMLPTSIGQQAGIPPGTLPTFGEVKRLLDCLGASSFIGMTVQSGNAYSGSLSALPFAAYQKIWYDHYRLSDRIPNDPEAYNLDSFEGTSGRSAQITLPGSVLNSRMAKLLQLRKRPYQRDYFTSMQVSPLMGSGDVNAAANSLTGINQWLSGLVNFQTAGPDRNSNALAGSGAVAANNVGPSTVILPNPTNQTASNANYGQLNPVNIRSMFAVEKLLEVTRRAKKHYDMQTLAHFGVSVPKGLAGECFKIGTHEQYIKIGEVVSTADTVDNSTSDGKPLGTLAGTGSSGGESKKFHFEAKCHCILMALYSAEPVVNYRQEGNNRLLTRTSIDDFYKPEFDNLGMQPVFAGELRSFQFTPGIGVVPPPTNVIGWQPRYEEQKAKYNRSFGGMSKQAFVEWSLRRDPINDGYISSNFFEVWPTDINGIMQVAWTGTENYLSVYSEDPFINQVYFNVQKSSKKSLYGMPNL